MLPRVRVGLPAFVAAVMLCGLTRATPARAEQFVATWQATSATTDAAGRLVRIRETGDALIAGCGDDQLPPIASSQLALVYDTAMDALEVVRVWDGSVVCVAFRFIASTYVGSPGGGGIRQALVVDGADGHAIGSVVGPIATAPGADGAISTIAWKGKLSASQRDPEDGTRRIVEGVFRTGMRFLPRATHPGTTATDRR